VVDASFSERRNGPAAPACCERALVAPAVTPVRVTTDKATGYPPALRAVRPGGEHRRSTSRTTGRDRDQSHLTQRLYPMRGFNRGAAVATRARGHARVRNLRGGVSSFTAAAAPNLRLATAWPRLMQAIERHGRPPSTIPHRSGARACTACPLSGNGTRVTCVCVCGDVPCRSGFGHGESGDRAAVSARTPGAPVKACPPGHPQP
jgi:hypothetical protein